MIENDKMSSFSRPVSDSLVLCFLCSDRAAAVLFPGVLGHLLLRGSIHLPCRPWNQEQNLPPNPKWFPVLQQQKGPRSWWSRNNTVSNFYVKYNQWLRCRASKSFFVSHNIYVTKMSNEPWGHNTIDHYRKCSMIMSNIVNYGALLERQRCTGSS